MVSYPAPARMINESCGAAWMAAAVTLVERTTRIPTSAIAPGRVSAFSSLRTSTSKFNFSSEVTASLDSLSAINTFMAKSFCFAKRQQAGKIAENHGVA